jgi:hypothetical protein
LNSEPGAWGIPILWILLLLPIGLALLAIAAARSRLVPWWPLTLILGSTVLHLAGIDGTTEIASHWILAAGLAWLGLALLRTSRRPQLGMFTDEAT